MTRADDRRKLNAFRASFIPVTRKPMVKHPKEELRRIIHGTVFGKKKPPRKKG